jgi:hypothetical protein
MFFCNKVTEYAKNFLGMIFYRKPRVPTGKYPPRPIPPANKGKKMKYYLNDPAHPNLIAEVVDSIPFGLQINVSNLQDGNYEFTSPQGLANNTYAVLCHGINMFNSMFGLKKWAIVDILKVNPMAGYEANAYYDRRNLKFFYFTKDGKKIFTALSADVVSHELGHALLDAIRPDLFSAAAMEAWAFHESFGDINSILCALHHNQLVDYLLQQTDGDLRKSNIVSRVAEEFGVALGRAFSLREAVNNYKYVNPSALPAESNDDNVICREPHSFSKIMTGIFYDVLCSIYEKLGRNKEALIEARDYCKQTFYKACVIAPCTSNFYYSFCMAWLQEDLKLGSKHKDILEKIFAERNINSVKMMLNSEEIPENKEKTETIMDFNTIVEKFHAVATCEELFSDEATAMSFDHELAGMKIVLAVDDMYIKDSFSMQSISEPLSEAKKAAKLLLEYIFNQKLFGKDEVSMWYKDENNTLQRRMFQCDCYMPNYLFPGNPEYNKPYKPKNNTGCCTYGSCTNNTPKPSITVEKNCNIRYSNSCRSTVYRGKC